MPNGLAGLKELSDKLALLSVKARKADLRAAARAGINVAKNRALATIPVGHRMHRTYKGRLVAPGFSGRNVRAIVVLSSEGNMASAHLGVTKEAFYAVQFTERGTVHEAAHPWIVPAFHDTLEQQTIAFADVLRRKIEQVAAGGT